MDVVLLGLSGSGKTEVGRRLAAARGAEFVDTDALVEREAGRSVAELFRDGGEDGFRDRERAVIGALPPPDPEPGAVRRVIASGGGAVVDPRNRWRLLRGRCALWLDAPVASLAARLGATAEPRPLLDEADRATSLQRQLADRRRFYAAATRVDASGGLERTIALAGLAADRDATWSVETTLLRAELPIGTLVVGESVAASAVERALQALAARRAILVSEPGAWEAGGRGIARRLAELGWTVDEISLPGGEAAKTFGAVEAGSRALARLRVGRDEPLVAIGGGALTDAAGFVAATYLRGVPWVVVPTTLLGQVDAALGGKTAVDLPEGKNLVGSFHLPSTVVLDVAPLAGLPVRHRRAALAEVVKDGILGEPRLLDLLEVDGPAIAAGTATSDPGAAAELVERAAWFKMGVVTDDPREQGDRISLNLGHSVGHALEATGHFRELLHGEAVAYGLRAAARLGVARGITPARRADRLEALLDALELGSAPLPWPVNAVMDHLAADKKRRDGRLRWVLPTADGWTLDDAIPQRLIRAVVDTVVSGVPAGAAR